jgi:hypothetical protein
VRIQFQMTIEPPARRSRTRARRILATAVVAIALAVPGVALGNHLFADVPADASFHTNIANLANAGVTAGCGGGNYCPTQPVSREQMAGFLNRGLGRIAEAEFQKSVTGVASSTLGTFTIRPGLPSTAVPGANQFLFVAYQGTLRFTNVTGCPCSVAVYLTVNGSAVTNFATATTVTVVNHYTDIQTSGAIPVTGSDPVTIAAVSYVVQGGGASTAYTMFANITAMTFPFGAEGGDTLPGPAPAAAGPLSVPVND